MRNNFHPNKFLEIFATMATAFLIGCGSQTQPPPPASPLTPSPKFEESEEVDYMALLRLPPSQPKSLTNINYSAIVRPASGGVLNVDIRSEGCQLIPLKGESIEFFIPEEIKKRRGFFFLHLGGGDPEKNFSNPSVFHSWSVYLKNGEQLRPVDFENVHIITFSEHRHGECGYWKGVMLDLPGRLKITEAIKSVGGEGCILVLLREREKEGIVQADQVRLSFQPSPKPKEVFLQ